MNCEDGCGIDDQMELPPPARTITNGRIEDVLAMELAMADTHDYVSNLPPTELPAHDKLRDDLIHGAMLDNTRWCTPCNFQYDMKRHPVKCPQCHAPWDRPVTEAA